MAVKKPLLRDATVRKHLAFAREHRDRTIAQWVFYGATKAPFRFSVGLSGLSYTGVWVKDLYRLQCVIPTVKHGGGTLMIWWYMSRLRVGQVYRCKGTMRQDQYISELRNHTLPSATALYGQGQRGPWSSSTMKISLG